MTTTTAPNLLVRNFLDRLRRASRDLPRGRRDELEAEISAHLAEALPPDTTDAAVLEVLDRLGDPEAIVAEERDRLGIARPRAGVLEWAAIALLLIGGLIVPLVGWLVGVVFLWISRVWTTREKLIGTLVVPGGLATAVFAFLVVPNYLPTSCTVRSLRHGAVAQCGPSPGVAWTVAWIAVAVALVVAPIVTAVFLGRRAQRASASAG
jgi:hypothetical protein